MKVRSLSDYRDYRGRWLNRLMIAATKRFAFEAYCGWWDDWENR